MLETRSYGAQRTAQTSEAVLAALQELALSTLGPAGRFKMIRANAQGALTVTSTSHRLFGALRLEHPLARVLAEEEEVPVHRLALPPARAGNTRQRQRRGAAHAEMSTL